jgi:YidC/Oxa1 family membrane protein insertase
MNFKELVLPLSLALITTWGVHHFFFSGSEQQDGTVRSGQGFIAPKTKQELKPLNTEIDFIEDGRQKPAQLSEVQTKQARLVFSTDGASLQTLEFKHVSNCLACPIQTISGDVQKENACFLVALGQKTPFYYDLIERKDEQDAVYLTYQAPFDGGTVTKKFTVHTNNFKIDLELTIEAKTEQGKQAEPRIFWPSPEVKAIAGADIISGIMSNEKGSLEKIAFSNLTPGQGWFSPSLFGSDDRYFIHAMVHDTKGFVQRAYFKSSTTNSKITSIIEGAASDAKDALNTWKVSFYMGPKEGASMEAVDPRLEGTLEYAGFFSPVSKFLLYVLKLLYGFVHNFGLAIILLTILVKLVLLPFTYNAEDGMQKRVEFDKKLRYLQQKYKDQPETLALERAELIKKHGMPGLSGCLPLLLQLPIFIALSRVLSSAIELYNAPFIGWIHDLSAKDPYYILPLITALSMVIQSMLMPSNDPKQRISTLIMALVIGAVTANLAAGLSLYICMFTILGVVQTQLLKAFKRA